MIAAGARISLDPEHLATRLEAYGLDADTRAALTPMAQLAGDADLMAALRGRLLQACLSGCGTAQLGDTALVGRLDAFAACYAELLCWDYSLSWLDRLLERWLEIFPVGLAMDLPARLGFELIDYTARLADAGEAGGDSVAATVVALGRLALFVTGMLEETSTALQHAQIERLTQVDEASGLPNATQLAPALAAQLELAAGGDGVTGLLMLRLEPCHALLRMSAAAERHLVAQIVARLRSALRPADRIFRLGRHRFALLLPQLRSVAQISLAAARLLRALEAPFSLDRREYRVLPTMGGAHAPEHGADAAALAMAAELALFEARSRGSRFQLFHEELDQLTADHAALEREFMHALEHDELALHLQPQISLASGRCESAEVLLRWCNQRGEQVPPPLIIEIAERVGASPQLTRWLAGQTCRMASMLRQSNMNVALALNLTANELRDGDLPDLIHQSLSTWRLPGSALTLEITEGAMIADQEHSLRIMHRLRDLGCRLAIDDFGTGYSSMAYLCALPVQELKIDQVFVHRMLQSPRDREIVGSMVQIAHSLEMEVVAEGVEQEAELAQMRDFGCERVQGHLYGQALPFEAFQKWWLAFEADPGRRMP